MGTAVKVFSTIVVVVVGVVAWGIGAATLMLSFEHQPAARATPEVLIAAGGAIMLVAIAGILTVIWRRKRAGAPGVDGWLRAQGRSR